MVTNEHDVELNTPIIQHTPSDSGVACLASIIHHYGGGYSLDKIRDLSRTSANGTSLLGLYRASQQLGFNVKGERAAEVKDIKELQEPAILHIDRNASNYFLVYYRYDSKSDKVIVGDPSRGIVNYTVEDLAAVWTTKSFLRLSPNHYFVKKSIQAERKRKLLSELIKDDLEILVLKAFLGLVLSLMCLASAIFIQKFFDDILPTGNQQKLLLNFLFIASVLLVYLGVYYWRNILRARQGMQFNNRVAQRFYRSLLRLPKSFFDEKKDNEFSARKNDIKLLQVTIDRISGDMVSDIIRISILIPACFIYSPAIGLITICMVPIHILVLRFFNRKIILAQEAVLANNARVETHYLESINSITDIKSLNKEDVFQSTHRNLYEQFQLKSFQLNKLNIQLSFVSEIVTVIVAIVIFGIATEKVLTFDLTTGELLSLIFMAGCIVHSLSRLTSSNSILQKARIAFNRLYEFVSNQLENQNSEGFSDGLDGRDYFKDDFRLKFKDLSFRFPGRKQLLRNVSLKAKRGEIVSILGESGSGKTTLLQILQKFYAPKSGKIEVNSIDFNRIPSKEWRNLIAVVPQEIKIFDNNLLYNLTLSDRPEEAEEVIEFCNKYGFAAWFENLKQGYNTILGENGINISEGQKQLIAIARALYRKPQLLVLDDSTSAMDNKMEKFVFELLQKLKVKIAIVFLTHRATIAQKADQIFLLENGEITIFGSPEELRLTENTFSKSVREFVF